MKEIFYNYITELIQDINNLNYEWRNNETEIIFHKNTDQGFDIIVGFDKQYIYLSTDKGYHDHFEVKTSFKEILIDVMGIVRDLLSQNMRIKEYLSNNKPYKWILQNYKDEMWHNESITSLILWNYFGKKSSVVYFNNILPKRELK